MNTAAFFDIDGTLHRNSLLIEHFKKLVKYEVIDPGHWYSKIQHTYNEWRKRQGDYEDYLLQLVDIYRNELKGKSKRDMEFVYNQVITLNGDVVYRYTRGRILHHKAEGHKVFFISGSPSFLVEKMAEKYDADDFRGAVYLTDDRDVFTGEVIPMWNTESKNRAISDFVNAYDIDLSASYAYGDTNGDLSMLKSVGFPVAINPTREMIENIRADRSLADRARIVVERKDVIYEFTPDTVSIREE